jgi:tetratricopeptide (TPR) repeat protein
MGKVTRLATLLVCLVLAAPAAADDFLKALRRPENASLQLLWTEGEQLEDQRKLLQAVDRYEHAARALPGRAYPLWRIARNYWRSGERLPLDDREGRLRYFEKAELYATRSLELDPECAECMLWRAASMGRLATTRGMVTAARQASLIAELLERGIALAPTHRDSDSNSTLGNLYHAAAAFYRLVPDWFWLEWVIGVRGDKERSVEYSRRAVALSQARLDYNVELGAGLLCLGTARHDEDRVREGRQVLLHSQELTPFLETDGIDLAYAQILLQQPEKACAYARDGFVDLEQVGLGPPGLQGGR